MTHRLMFIPFAVAGRRQIGQCVQGPMLGWCQSAYGANDCCSLYGASAEALDEKQKMRSFSNFRLGLRFCLGLLLPLFVSRTAFASVLYISNGINHSVSRINTTGTILQTTVFVNQPGNSSFPDGLKFDNNGNLFIADDGTHNIRKLGADGSVSTIGSAFGDPLGLAIDPQRNLFVSDGATGQIYRVTQGGSVTTFITPLALHDPSESAGLAFDANGNLYDAAPPANTVFKITPSGSVSTFATLNSPEDLAFDGSGNLYVSSFSDGTITRITPNGTKSIFATGLIGPVGIAFDGGGTLFVAEHSQNGSIASVSPGGAVTTIAPNYGQLPYFIAVPVPEPSSLILLVIGSLAVSGMAICRKSRR